MARFGSAELKALSASVVVGEDSWIIADEVAVGDNVRLGDRVRIEGQRVRLDQNVTVSSDVTIRAAELTLLTGARISERCQISAIGQPARYVQIGEQSLLSHDCKVLVPAIALGDYVAIHNHTLVNGLKPVEIGHNCWVGQNCILNANDRLTLGNHVGIGAYCCLYTHGFFGDLLEGCQVNKVAPIALEDDVWLLGSYSVISPGVTVGAKALVMSGSNVTRDIPPNRTFGGTPARDMTDRLVPFKDVTVGDKYARIQQFLEEYVEACYPGKWARQQDGFEVDAPFGQFTIRWVEQCTTASLSSLSATHVVFTKDNQATEAPPRVTVFDLSRRDYRSSRTEAEIRTISYLKTPRARFVPRGRERVRIPAEVRAQCGE